jgi:acetoin utilization deacetylase AcuC-like enzyme
MKKPNGIIKTAIFPLTITKVENRIFTDIFETLAEAKITEQDTRRIISEIIKLAISEMGNKATVMGGYSVENQLYDKACVVMARIDETEGLESLLEQVQDNQI